MKKLLSLLLICLISLSAISCSVTPKGEYINNDKDLIEYFNERELLFNFSYKVTYEKTEKTKTLNSSSQKIFKLSAVFNYNEDGEIEGLEYTVKQKTKDITSTLSGKEKMVTVIREKAVVIANKDETLNYFDLFGKQRGKNIRSKQSVKSKTQNEFYDFVTTYYNYEMLHILVQGIAFSGYSYLNGDDLYAVFSNFTYKETVKITCTNKEIKNIKIIQESANTKEITTINICKKAKISSPKDSDKYQ